MVFAQRLNALKDLEHLSTRKLSIKARVDRKALQDWLDGKYLPRYDAFINIANYFEVSLDYLVGLENECYAEYKSEVPIKQVPDLFVARLKEMLSIRGLNAHQLAQKMEIEQSTISKWINRVCMPEMVSLLSLAKWLNVSIDYLYGRSPK